MKKILVSLLLVSLFSCSDDDNSSAGNGLRQTKQTLYDNGAIDEVVITNFRGGRINDMAFYTPGNVLEFTTGFQYNSSGQVSKITASNPSGQAAYSTDYIYDNQQRLKTIQHNSGAYSYVVNYTFNNDNTISAVHSTNPGENKTFYVNQAGLVYKEVTSSGYYELTFDGVNPVSGTSGFGVKTFTYDNEHNPALLPYQTIQDTYKPNEVLRARYLYDAETSTANKYLKSETGNGETREYVRTFNAQGYPTLLKSYSNNVLYSQTEYIYN